jgi:hypothetical protein
MMKNEDLQLQKLIKPKSKKSINHLISWYHGNFCAKCGKIDSEEEEYGKKCYNKLLLIRDNIQVNEMTHKEFVNLIRHTSFCHPTTRHFEECKVCRLLGLNDQYWIKNWKGWNLSETNQNNP